MRTQINLRESVNVISDVVNNRPRPLRKFDQIFMKTADMLLQTEHVSRHLEGRRVVCIGDGDAIGLCLVHLLNENVLEQGPKSVCVLDFDERVVYSVKKFAEKNKIEDKISAELYNVIDPLPKKYWGFFDGFYTNPPFGASNDGVSVKAFVRRGIEAVGKEGVGCIVIADDREHEWSQIVLKNVQGMILDEGCLVSEVIPAFHKYHLDDSPDLTSCSMIIRRAIGSERQLTSEALPPEQYKDFYGKGKPLQIKYVRDLTKGGQLESKDYEFEYIKVGK